LILPLVFFASGLLPGGYVMTDLDVSDAGASRRVENICRRVFLASLAIVLLLAGIYLLLALPANDDFVRATQPRVRGGLWNYVFKFQYFRWQGRWAACGLESLLLDRENMPAIYPVILAALAAINCLAVYVICRWFTRAGARRFSLVCALGFVALIWSSIPSTAQTVYWVTGNIENVMVLCLSGLLLVGLAGLKPSRIWWSAAAISAICICGLHELFGAVLCLLLGVGMVWAFATANRNRIGWALAFAAAIVGIAIVVAAPGNGVRMRTDGGNHIRHLWPTIQLTALQLSASSQIWGTDPKLILASLWIIFSPTLEASRPTSSAGFPWRWIVPPLWIVILWIGFFAPSWAFGITMPPRTLSGNYVIFAMGWLAIVYLWSRGSGGNSALRARTSAAVVAAVLGFTMVFTGNGFTALHDLANRRALTWRTSMESRYSMLRQTRQAEVVVPPLMPPCDLLYSSEISERSDDWHNQSLAAFFHVNRLVLQRTSSPIPSEHSQLTDPAPPLR
jgi:hypothetical protein